MVVSTSSDWSERDWNKKYKTVGFLKKQSLNWLNHTSRLSLHVLFLNWFLYLLWNWSCMNWNIKLDKVAFATVEILICWTTQVIKKPLINHFWLRLICWIILKKLIFHDVLRLQFYMFRNFFDQNYLPVQT